MVDWKFGMDLIRQIDDAFDRFHIVSFTIKVHGSVLDSNMEL